jgi:hypothetical protein
VPQPGVEHDDRPGGHDRLDAGIGRAIRGAYLGEPFEAYRLYETPQDAFHRLHDGRVERIDCGPAALAQA